MAKVKIRSQSKLKGQPTTIDVHYIKTSSYRTYYVDGVFGGLTPTGKLYMEFFVQRAVTPQIIKYKVTPDGLLSQEETGRIGKAGIVRQIEAGFEMDIEIAKVLRDWLDKRISNYEKDFLPKVKKDKDKKNG